VKYAHPHPSPSHVAQVYRAYLRACMNKWGITRGLFHARELWTQYLAAQRASRLV